MTHSLAGAPHPRPPDGGPDALLVGLTPEQAQAVRHGRGPLLIVAGPGTGKTRTLTHRVAHLAEHPRRLTHVRDAGAGWSSTRCRTPTRRRPRSCSCSPGRPGT